MRIPGLVVPPLTPFAEDLSVDYAALKAQVDYVVDQCDAAMVVAAGVEAQEYHYLTLEQRRDLIRRTIEFVGGRRPVAVGISHPSFKTAIDLAHLAEDLRAASIQVLAPLRPFGGAPTVADLVAYYEAIARETKLPIMLYLNPGPGADVSVDATIELAKMERVAFIKESSRDMTRVGRLIAEIDIAGHARYFTTMQMLLITLLLGGSGATMPPPSAEICRRILDAFAEKNIELAAKLQGHFCRYPAQWMHRGLTPTMKASMEILGRPLGEPFPPYQGLSKPERAALRAFLETTCLSPKAN